MRVSTVAATTILLVQTIMYFLPISVEWKAVFFLFSLIVATLFRIDSRFFILAAILHLWFAPFMLIAEQKAYAEATAIYAYYYLVIGVLGQSIEHVRKKEPSVTLEQLTGEAFRYPFWKYFAVGGSFMLLFAYIFQFTGDNFQFRLSVLWYCTTVALGVLAARWLLEGSAEQNRARKNKPKQQSHNRRK